MVLRLAETLDVPLRDRNVLLLAAGFAPAFGERPLADPGLDGLRVIVEAIVQAHAPNPALAVDRHWTLYRALTTTDFGGELRALQLPVLVIQGEADASSPPHLTGHPTAALVPGARLLIYPDAPHGLCVSHPGRLNADLLRFIRNDHLDGCHTRDEP